MPFRPRCDRSRPAACSARSERNLTIRQIASNSRPADLSSPRCSLTIERMTSRLLARRALCVAALAALAHAGAVSAQSDADFAAARDAFRAGDAARLERIAPRLKDHLLAPYVEYWRLKLGIDEADAGAVRAFLDRYADLPLAEQLRIEWLKSLARRGEWTLFGAEYAKRPGEDTELACYATQWR